jgi:hypothetical protein
VPFIPSVFYILCFSPPSFRPFRFHTSDDPSPLLGEALAALQKFVSVVWAYFPARPGVAHLLGDLNAWMDGHEDALRGEDLSAWLEAALGRYAIQVIT